MEQLDKLQERVIKRRVGKLPVLIGDYEEGRVYDWLNRVTIYGCEMESKMDGNDSVPARLNEKGDAVLFNTERWRLISDGSAAWLFKNRVSEAEEAIKGLKEGKVDKVAGKGLSTNDYTTADKQKLAGVAAGAEVNVITGIQRNGTDLQVLGKKVNISVPTKTSELSNDDHTVKDANYTHTDNNYTTADKQKLAGVAAGATANQGTITGIKMNGAVKGTSGVVDLGTVMTLTVEQLKEQLGITDMASAMIELAERVVRLEENGSTPVTPVTDEYPTITYTNKFNDLIDEFNGTGVVSIPKNSSNAAYSYLKKYYDEAEAQFKSTSSPLFLRSTYPEIDGYSNIDGVKGTNKSTYELAFDAMCGWLMAMCLSELKPSSGTSSNNQTVFFKTGYEYNGNGASVPLYDNYDIHCDPMIARLAAGAVYAKLHDGLETERAAARTALGGGTISGSSWDSLGVKTSSGESVVQGNITSYDTIVGTIGYIVNSFSFLPDSPGPFASGRERNRTIPPEQPSGQFHTSNPASVNGFTKDWYRNNYKVDVAIDEKVVEDYKINGQIGYNDWVNSQGKERSLLAMKAVVVANDIDSIFLSKRVKPGAGTDGGYYTFVETSESVTPGNQVYDVAGPFAELQSKMFGAANSIYPVGQPTAAMDFIKAVMHIADNSRVPSMGQYCGRRRPCGNATDGTARVPNNGTVDDEGKGYTTSRWNGINNRSLAVMFANTAAELASRQNETDWVANDKAKSYVSGHSAMMWAAAMMLTQAFAQTGSFDVSKYMKAAYEGCVLRSIGRYHWNSDIMYGRLFGSMVIPIVNAMTGLQNPYNSFKSVVTGSSAPSAGGSVTVDYNSYMEGGSGSATDITVNIHNDTGSAITLGMSENGAYRIVHFQVNGTEQVITSSTRVTIDAGGSATVTGPVNSSLVGQSFGSKWNFDTAVDTADGYSNVLGNLFSGKTYGAGTYDIHITSIGSGTGAGTGSVTYGGSGSATVSADKIKVVINNNSGSTLTALNRINFLVVSNGSNSRIGHITLDSPISVASGSSQTLIGTLDETALTHVGEAFSTDFEDYGSNVILYDPANNGYALYGLGLPAIVPSEASQGFRAGATYTINYGGSGSGGSTSGGSGTTPSVTGGTTTSSAGNVTGTVTIINESGSSKTIGSRGIWIGVYGQHATDEYYGWFRFYAALPGSITLANGESMTFSMTFTGDPEAGLGLPFATQAQYTATGRKSNNAYYAEDGTSYTMTPVSPSYTFKNGAAYVLVIPSDTQAT